MSISSKEMHMFPISMNFATDISPFVEGEGPYSREEILRIDTLFNHQSSINRRKTVVEIS
jgi:hypothetical protein